MSAAMAMSTEEASPQLTEGGEANILSSINENGAGMSVSKDSGKHAADASRRK